MQDFSSCNASHSRKHLTGMRFACLTLLFAGLAVQAKDFPAPAVAAQEPAGKATAVLAGGCFWGVEAVFERVKGVSDVVSGYAGGSKSTANYDTVSSGRTGHAESVQITYDPSQVSFGQLLQVYFSVAHDPTELNRQGPDSGTQYRSEIFYTNAEQKKAAEAYIAQLNASKIFRGPIVTKVEPLAAFFPAEEHHQNFIARNPRQPYVVYNDLPKLAELQKRYPELLKSK